MEDNRGFSQREEEWEIDMGDLLRMLLHRLWLILLAMIGGAAAAFIISRFLITPRYQSTTKIYILNRENSNTVTASDLQLGTQLTKDYAELIQCRYVLETVSGDMGLGLSYKAMKEMVTVSNPADTRILSITVTDTDPARAKEIADYIRDVSAEHIRKVMDIEAVNMVEDADLPPEQYSPDTSRNMLLGGAAGGAGMVLILVLVYLLDDSIKGAQDVERYLNMSVLAVIPLDEEGKTAKSKKRK